MFCDRCGRLLNRATGRCVCDDDATLAVPVGSGGAATAVAVAPAPAATLTEKEVADAAVAARQVTALNGRAPDAGDAAAESAPYVPTGRVRAVIGGLRDGRRSVELRIHDDALVVSKGGDDAGVALPIEQIVAITLHRKPWGGSVHIGAGRSGSRTLRFSKRKVVANDLAGQLQAVGGRRFSSIPMSDGLQLAYRLGKVVAVLAVVAAVAIPVKAIAFPAPKPGDDLPAAARDAVRGACPAWRAAPLKGAELAATAQQVRPAFETAAKTAPVFASLPADVGVVEQFAPKAGRPDVPLAEAAAFSEAVDHIDAACARVGA